MATPDENAITLSSYDARVDAYIAGTGGEHPHALLRLFVDVIVPPSNILEIGSGPGLDAHYLRAAGYRITATDASSGFLTYLRAAGWPAAGYDFDRDDPPDGAWEAVYANAVMHHLRRDRLGPALARLHRGLRHGALLVASVKTGRDDGWSHAKIGAPRWFTYWSPGDLRDVLTGNGWKIELLTTRSGAHDDWLDAVARR